jgi:hypothetical protein
MKGLSAGSDQVNVHVLSGPTFATSTLVLTIFTGLPDASWTTYHFNVVNWRNTNIKVKITRLTGTVGVDDVGPQRLDIAGWTPSADAVFVAGSPSGSAVQTSGTLTSDEFTLPEDVQNLSPRYQVATSGTGLTAELLYGTDFGSTMDLNGGSLGGATGVWHTFKANVAARAGESVKLRVRPALGPIKIDDFGVLEKAVPGWQPEAGFDAVQPGSDANGSYLTSFKSGGAIKLGSGTVDTGSSTSPTGSTPAATW